LQQRCWKSVFNGWEILLFVNIFIIFLSQFEAFGDTGNKGRYCLWGALHGAYEK